MGKQYIAPNGGWGWVIVIAYGLNNIVTIPILQGFGMIYGSSFKRLGIPATQATIIMNINQAFGMILGIMNGPLLRKYGYRKIAISGTLLVSAGVICTSFATSFIHFVITYGMITSLGMGITMSAFSLALNTYFKEKRGRAVGMSMTITGLGPIFMPHLSSLLLSIYGSEGTMLTLGALSLHALMGALLLHPIQWHAKPLEIQQQDAKPEEDESAENTTQESATLLTSSKETSINIINSTIINENKLRKRSRTMTISSTKFDDDNTSVYGFELPLSMHNASLSDLRIGGDEESTLKSEENLHFKRQLSLSNFNNEYKRSNSFGETKCRKNSVPSKIIDDSGLLKIAFSDFPEEEEETHNHDTAEKETSSNADEKNEQNMLPPLEKSLEKKEKHSGFQRFLRGIVNFFDLSLFQDPIYVNIMLGMSIAIFAEFNFSVLTPFILTDMYLNTNQIATVMSIIAAFDLVFRAAAPYIGEWLHKSPRIMYFISLILLIFSRSGLLFINSYTGILLVSVGLGVAKGFRTVYMSLVIPSHVPLERLAAASSIQSLVNGFILLAAGPFIGVIRDITGSYRYCILFINLMTGIVLIMWMIEFIIKFIRKRGKPNTGALKLEQAESKS